MPIEIRELHIRVAVSPEAGRQADTPQSPPADGGGGGGADKDAIVAECVEQVVQILQARKER
jgi:hypothetical protein